MLPWVYNMRIKFTIWMSLSEVIKTISTYCMRACVKCISTSTHFFFYNSLVDCNKSLHKYFKERENALYNLLIAGWAMFFFTIHALKSFFKLFIIIYFSKISQCAECLQILQVRIYDSAPMDFRLFSLYLSNTLKED